MPKTHRGGTVVSHLHRFVGAAILALVAVIVTLAAGYGIQLDSERHALHGREISRLDAPTAAHLRHNRAAQHGVAALLFAELLALVGVLLWMRRQFVAQAEGLQATLTFQSLHDALTELPNRALFLDRVRHAVACLARGGQAATLLLDLDDFKTVNDSLGHAAGDDLLKIVARRLQHATRGGDTVARLGGDEFGVLLEGMAREDDLHLVLERIRAALDTPVRLAAREIRLSASIGVAHAHVGECADELLRNADTAMYRAKAAGKDGFAIFAPGMHAAALRRFELEADLRAALARDEFRVVYQPIVELGTRRVVGAEALVRWLHPTRGTVSPAEFVPFAEQTGLIVELGRRVLADAARQAAAWSRVRRDGAAPLTVTVNVAGKQLQDPGFVPYVAEVIAAHGLSAGTLALELTEGTLIEHSEIAQERLAALKSLGVRLAIDDFGTGYSSLGYLQRFSFDVLKIDKGFIERVAEDGRDAALTAAIVALGDALSLRVVAEGVETEAQREALRAMGCTLGQGYLFAHPVPAAEVTAMLRVPMVA